MRRILFAFLICLGLLSCAVQKQIALKTIKTIRFIGEDSLPYNFQFKGTTVGGLSSIDYSSKDDVYYFICDDRSDINPIRYYTAKIKLANTGFEKIELVNVNSLLQKNGQPFYNRKQNPLGVPDPEAMRYDLRLKAFAWSSEGERTVRNTGTYLTNPAVFLSSKDGRYIDTFSLPKNLQMRATESGPRNNGVFEGLTFSPDSRKLYVSLEEPLYEDGQRAGLFDSSGWVRFIQFDVTTKQPVAQFAYQIDPVVQEPISQGLFKV